MPRTHLSLHLGQAVFLWAGQHVQSAPHEHASPHLQLHSGFGREEHSGGSVLLAKALGQGRASQEGQGQCFLRPPTQPRALHAVLAAPQPGCGSHFTEVPAPLAGGPAGASGAAQPADSPVLAHGARHGGLQEGKQRGNSASCGVRYRPNACNCANLKPN